MSYWMFKAVAILLALLVRILTPEELQLASGADADVCCYADVTYAADVC
jgi:hypothetical protein